MLEFILIEENISLYNKIKNIIEKELMNYDYNYLITSNIKDNNNYKIYIIDCTYNELNNINNLKNIRYEKNDWTSMLIIISNKKKKKEIEDYKLMPIDIIDNNIEENIIRSIKISIMNYDNRPNTIKYKYKNTYYNIEQREIIYIEKEKDSKRTIIKTSKSSYPYPTSITNIEKILDKRFIKCSRSYIINLGQVLSYNTKDNVITFKDNSVIYEISRNKKKEIVNYLRHVD